MHGTVAMSGLMGDELGFPRRRETISMVRMLEGEVGSFGDDSDLGARAGQLSNAANFGATKVVERGN